MRRYLTRLAVAGAFMLTLGVVVSGSSGAVPSPEKASSFGPRIAFGGIAPRGNGWMATYAFSWGSQPISVGVTFPKTALEGLPHHPATDGDRCYDVNGDGSIDDMMECMGGYREIIPMPTGSGAVAPYTFFMNNWNPHGHAPVYQKSHFDFHFYLPPLAEVDAIRTGPCGLVINCDDEVRAKIPLPPQYMPAGYTAVDGAAEVAMGDHMVDLTSPEFTSPTLFSKTFIYGKYDGKLTFLEPMITLEYLQSLQSRTQEVCTPIPQPQAWQTPGWYPRKYCIRYEKITGMYTVSLDDFRRG